jgi:predicted helicase
LLVDYKVIVLAIDEIHVNQRLQKLLADENNQLKVEDAAKIVGSSAGKPFPNKGQAKI